MKHILLAGCGKMGSALLEGWLTRIEDDIQFTVIDPALAADHPFAGRKGVTVLPEAGPDTPKPDMVVLAVKPQVMDEALGPLAKLAGPGTVWLSIAAGISIDRLRSQLSPDAAVIRTMPNTPAAIGRGVTAMVASGSVPKDMLELAERMLSVVGRVVHLDSEEHMDAVTAVSGSGPAYVFLLRESLEAAAVEAGLPPEVASVLAGETLLGAALLLDESEESAGQLRVNVTSPGGTTEAALEVLMAGDGLESLLKRAVVAARDRSRALGN